MKAFAVIMATIVIFELIAVPIVEAQLEYEYYFGPLARWRRKKRIKMRQKSRRKALKLSMGKLD